MWLKATAISMSSRKEKRQRGQDKVTDVHFDA